MWQDQADEVNDLTARIGALTQSLKVVGFYAGGPEGEGVPSVEKAARPGFENQLIAVKAWDLFRKSSGSDGSPIVFWPADKIAEVIKECVELRKQTIDDIYQLTGISDIMRGDTESEETAAAQGIKSIWGSVRLKTRQQEIARVARDVMRMMAEIICEQFQMQTMLECANIKLPTDADVQQANQQFEAQQAQIAAQQQAQAALPPPSASGQPPAPRPAPGPIPGQPGTNPAPPAQPSPGAGPPSSGVALTSGQSAPPQPPQPPDLGPTQEDVQKFLQNKVLVRYVVDIETDSTIQLDQEKEQTQRTEFIDKSTRFLTGVMPVAESQPDMLPFLGQLFLFGVRAFPVARELQEAAEKMIAQMEKQAGQPAKPNPEMLKIQMEMERGKAQIETAKIDQQTEQIKGQAEVQKAQAQMEATRLDHGLRVQQMQLDHQQTMAEHQMKQKTLAQEVQVMEQKMAAQQALEGMKAQHQRDLAQQDHMHSMEQGRQSHEQAMASGVVSHQQALELAKMKPMNAKPGARP